MKHAWEATLGCGLAALGRLWNFYQERVLSDWEAMEFLDSAFTQGIRYFDTSPAYGVSEARLGLWLETLTREQRRLLTISTKVGEHWNANMQVPFVDYSLSRLKRSLNQSLRRLGKIDILLFSQVTVETLNGRDIWKALEYALNLGIPKIGVSITDLVSGNVSLVFDEFSYVQLPLSRDAKDLKQFISQLNETEKRAIVTQPFSMGALFHHHLPLENDHLRTEAFKFILKSDPRGYVLTGTTSSQHLAENIKAFETAKLLLA